jgi:hypothetical protein
MHVRHRVRRAAVLAGTLLAVSAGVVSATTVAASASVDPPGSTTISHHCVGIGNDGTTRGVVCADLMAVPDGNQTHYFGQNEVYCQNLSSRGFVRCSGIHETPGIGADYRVSVNGLIEDDASTFGGGQQICGTVFHHSACAVRETVHVASEADSYEAPSLNPNVVGCSFWGESVRTSVRLPGSGQTVSINVLATARFNRSC